MKALMLSISCMVPFAHNVQAQDVDYGDYPPSHSILDKILAFSDMEKRHKADWFELAKRYHAAKYDLLKKHHNEIFDTYHYELTRIKDEGLDAEALEEDLRNAIALHENQVQDWRELHQRHHHIASQIYHAHKQELNKFKQSLEN